MSVGHDEYYSLAMRQHLCRFSDSGGALAFFGGNNVCWQVVVDPCAEDPLGTMTCYKQFFKKQAPEVLADENRATGLINHPETSFGIPSHRLMGIGCQYGGYHRCHGQLMHGGGGYTINAGSGDGDECWVTKGTGACVRSYSLYARDAVCQQSFAC